MSADPFGYMQGQANGDWPFFNGVQWMPSHLSSRAYVLVPAYLYVGSQTTKPTNTTAGDLTAGRIFVPDQGTTGLTGLVNVYSNGASSPVVSRNDSSSTGPNFRAQGATVIPSYQGVRGAGSVAAPTAVVGGQTLVELAGAGFYDTANISQQAQWRLSAAENWSSTNRGTQALLQLTPTGSTTIGSQHLWTPTGFLTTGFIAAGYSSDPATAAAGVIVSSGKIFPSNDANFWLVVTSLKPTLNMDSGDYYEYDRTNNRHSFFVGNTEMHRVQATAIEHKSYSASVANSSGTQTISQSVVTAVTFATEDYDTGAIHDTVSNTSRLTAPVTGRYHVTGGVLWGAEAVSTTTFLMCRLSKNGVVIPGSRSYFPPISSLATNGQGQNVAMDIALTAGDYVELEVFYDQNAATTRTITLSGCKFAMHYIGGL